jgi:hypothetical protein
MSYAVVQDFKSGMQRIRMRANSKPGSLWGLTNAHITRGGDIESVRAFVPKHSLPPGTFGLHSVRGRLFVFGSGSTPIGMPVGVEYQRLQHPTLSADMTALVWAENFDGLIYAIAEYDDGSVWHFYDGARVMDWDAIALAVADNSTLASYLATRIDNDAGFSAYSVGDTITIIGQPGVAYSVSAAAVDGGGTDDQDAVVASVAAATAATEESISEGSFDVTSGVGQAGDEITSVTVNGTEVMGGPVQWAGSNAFTAGLIAQNINAHNSTPEYTASASDGTVTIRAAAGTGATPNGFIIAATATGQATVGNLTNFAGGVSAAPAQPQVDTVTISGTPEVADRFTITLDGTDYVATMGASGTGRTALTYDGKVYSIVLSLVYFCSINDPMDWDDSEPGNAGAGNINFATQDEGSEFLQALEIYQGNLVVFSENNIQVEFVGSDPAANSLLHSLRKTGTRAGGSVLAFGNNDVFYLSNTGVRSIRARDSSNAPYVNDVGTLIDTYVLGIMDSLGGDTVAKAHAVLEPREGRYWLAIGPTILVFSYFPGDKISAWSTYSPGITFDAFATVRQRVYCRSGDTIYLYGGDDGNTYPSSGEITITVELPYLTGDVPGNNKRIIGVDVAATGIWSIALSIDPNNDAATTEGIRLTGVTHSKGHNKSDGRSTHIAPNLTCSSGGPAVLSSLVLYFDKIGEPR